MCDHPADSATSAPIAQRVAAFYDVDGTLVSTHIVHQYVRVRAFLARRRGILNQWGHRIWLSLFYLRCLQYLYLDRVSRTRMNVAFYRNYSGLNCNAVRQAVGDCFDNVLRPHLFPDAASDIESHLLAGRRVVLVTGSIDFLIEPLARYFGGLTDGDARVDLVARTLVHENGRFTGVLDGPPIGGEEKAAVVREYASREHIDLTGSYAFGDSIADLPMLELVGHPCVVNPDARLAVEARQRGWPTKRWAVTSNGL